MKKIVSATLFAFAILILVSCKKNDTGGKVTITVTPKHHDEVIYGATAYVKFDATELPLEPTKNYDLMITAEGQDPTIRIENLRYGNYFVYCVGYDPAIKLEVKGGISFDIRWKARKDDLNVIIPITE